MKNKNNGFTLVELMIVVAIIGILSMFALPAYQDYTKRTHVSEGLQLAGMVKNSYIEYLSTNGEITSYGDIQQLHQTLGLAAPSQITGNAVKSVSIAPDMSVIPPGLPIITITYNRRVVEGGQIVIVPNGVGYDSNQTINWDCHIVPGTGMKEQWVPSNCR